MKCGHFYGGVRHFSMQWKNPKNGSVSKWHFENKTSCHYHHRKTKLFFQGKNGFSWGTPLRAVFVIIIIMLVEKKDILEMSFSNIAAYRSRWKYHKTVLLGYAVNMIFIIHEIYQDIYSVKNKSMTENI